MKNYTLILLLAAIIYTGCRQAEEKTTSEESALTTTAESKNKETTNSIYHWKTIFAPDNEEMAFLRRHNISRMYVRMFDVALERNYELERWDIVPIATTKFGETAPNEISNLNIIPTTYITSEALREMQGKESHYAELIVERLRAMATHNKLGEIREMQFDCDWTNNTREIYFRLCDAARLLLHKDSIELSSTIRLHQLDEVAPPADRGVLMLYNTGNLKSIKTTNSILDINDVKPYLQREIKYPLALDYVYPTFGWGVKFYSEEIFEAIVSNPETEKLKNNETIRIERPTIDKVLEVKKLVEKQLGKPTNGNIIYHFDKEQLSHYSDDEIDKIFSNN